MYSDTLYAIFWDPGGQFAPAYEQLIEGWIHDVAADDGKPTNAFAIATQYGDGHGGFGYGISYGGAAVDTQPYPANGCPLYPGVSRCLLDSQFAQEVDRFRLSQGWPSDLTHEYMFFTPSGIGSCFYSNGTNCAYSTYCAYHLPTAQYGTVYSNMPYPENGSYPGACDAGQHPNGHKGQGSAAADAAINLSSHEIIESVTDPGWQTAWFDSVHYEIADKCVWLFGTLRGMPGAEYNQVINGNKYIMQEEYSNQIHDCPQFSPFLALSPSSGPAGRTVRIRATVGGLSWSGQVTIAMGSHPVNGSFVLDAYGNAWVRPLVFHQDRTLPPGNYTVTVTDAGTGVQVSAPYTIT